MTTGQGPNLDEMMERTKVEPPPPDPIHERWCRWLDDIDEDLTEVALARYVWTTVNEVVEKAALPGSILFDMQARNYSSAQASAIRRQGDRRTDVVTLYRLLNEIATSSNVLTRERYVARFPWGMQNIGDQEFDEWSKPGSPTVDAANVLVDLETLKTRTAAIKKYVDKHVAHRADKRPPKVTLTFDDLHEAMDTLFELFRKYSRMLTGVERAVMTPTPQYDWLAPLRVAWLPDGG